jgi:anti-anti-sigma factor
MLATDSSCDLEVERGPDWLLVRVGGLDPAEANEFPLALQVWCLLQQHFTYRLVLELDQVRLLTSHLIGQLAELHRRIDEHGGVMRLCGLSSDNCQVLQACGAADSLTPYGDRQTAVMGGEDPRRPR